jgi:glutathione peroxidase
MKFIFSIITLTLLSTSLFSQSTIYKIKIDSAGRNKKIDFSAFKEKKILIVNAASQDSNFSQFEELQQLSLLQKDSLVVVIVPSNSFNSEPANDSAFTLMYNLQANDNFFTTTKISVTGNGIHSLYKWLTQKLENGAVDTEVKAPFKKFLINEKGILIGVFSKRVKPLSKEMFESLQN